MSRLARVPPRPQPPLPLAVDQRLLDEDARAAASGVRSSCLHPALSDVFACRGIGPDADLEDAAGYLIVSMDDYATSILDATPELPVEENARLHDPALRENFVTRTFAYAHWRALERAGITAGRLVAFHSRYKYLLMAHSVPHYHRAGRLLANLEDGATGKAGAYIGLLMRGLTQPAGRRGHANVLSHLQGYFKRHLDGPTRQQLDDLVHRYRRGELPLLAPIALIKDHLRQHPDEYVGHQVYLDPHPGYPDRVA